MFMCVAVIGLTSIPLSAKAQTPGSSSPSLNVAYLGGKPVRNTQNGTCSGATVRGSQPKAPRGYASVTTVTIKGDCTLEISAVQFVPASQAPAYPPANRAASSSAVVTSAPGVDTSGPPGGIPDSQCNSVAYCETDIDQQLHDAVGILLNDFDTRETYTQTSSTTWDISATGFWAAHKESTPAGSGWSFHQGVYILSDCSVGSMACSEWDEQANFTYQGIFDPTGKVYSNMYEGDNIVYPSEPSWECHWTYSYQTGFPGWSWKQSCNAYS